MSVDLTVPFDVIDQPLAFVPGSIMAGSEYMRSMHIIDTADFDGICTWKYQVVAKNTTGADRVVYLKRITAQTWSPDVFNAETHQSFTIPVSVSPTLINLDFTPADGRNLYYWSLPTIAGLTLYTGRPTVTQIGATKTLVWRPLIDSEPPVSSRDYIGYSGTDTWMAVGGTFYWDAAKYTGASVTVVLEATAGGTYGGCVSGVRLYDVTAAAGVDASEFNVTSGGSFRWPEYLCDRHEFPSSALVSGNLHQMQFRRVSSWGGGLVTDWLTSAMLGRACFMVRITGLTSCEVAYRVAKTDGGAVEGVIGTSRAIVSVPAGTAPDYVKNETCSQAGYTYSATPEEDFWITDDGANVSGDGSSASNVADSNAHQGNVAMLLPIFSADWKGNFVSGNSFCVRSTPTVLGGDADSAWTLIVIAFSAAPSSCLGVVAGLNSDTMTITGTGTGSAATAWRVIRQSDGAVMDSGSGAAASFSFVGEYAEVYQLQFSGDGLTWSDTGCTFDFTAPLIVPGTSLPAHWHNGYFGIDTPRLWKMWRYGRLITDQTGFRVQLMLVDHVQSTFRHQELVDFQKVDNSFIPVNHKSKLLQYFVKFPDEDIDANVLELSSSHIPLSER